jgi:hypothetical protein
MKTCFIRVLLGFWLSSLSTFANIKVEVFKPNFIDKPTTDFEFPNKNIGQRLVLAPKPIYSYHEMLMITIELLNKEILKIASYNLAERFEPVPLSFNNGFRIIRESDDEYLNRLSRNVEHYIKPAIEAGARVLCLQGVPSEINLEQKDLFLNLLKTWLPNIELSFDFIYGGKNMIIVDKALRPSHVSLSDIQFSEFMRFSDSNIPKMMAIYLPEAKVVIVNQQTPWVNKLNETVSKPGPVVENFRKVVEKLYGNYRDDMKIIIGDFNREDYEIKHNMLPAYEGDTNDIQFFADLISPNITPFRTGHYTSLKYLNGESSILSSSGYVLQLPREPSQMSKL